MKRTLLIFFTLIIMISVVTGCISTQTPQPSPSPGPDASPVPTSPSLVQPPATEPVLTPTPKPEPIPVPAIPVPPPAIAVEELKVHFIDVGQGDSILVDLGSIEILIDGGGRSPGIVPYLENYVDGAIEVMVATHPHADHIGGLIDVLSAYEVKEIWHNGDKSDSKTYADFMSSVESEGAVVHVARLHDTIKVGGLSLFVHHPANLDGSTNNNSIVLHLAYGEIDFLFTGDAEREAEGKMMLLSSVRIPEVEILKVGHHGSRTASSKDFLAITSPEVAIYMAKEGNSYGHPHDETIESLHNIGTTIYGTDVHGNIVVVTDGKNYELQLDKGTPQTTETSPTPKEPEQPSPGTTPGSTPTLEPEKTTNVQITHIFFDGQVYRTESDEYVEIKNLGSESVDLAGWKLADIAEGSPTFTFPSYTLQPGGRVRVYTNEIHSEYGGFSFGYGKAIWNNSSPDTAVLYDAQGQEVSRRSY